MHRSRLTSILIDCAEEDWQRSLEFWSGALGRDLMPEEGDDPRYVNLRGRMGSGGAPYVMLQRVPREQRAIHLDIETDDIEAEVARLEQLGARVKARISNHVVMLAPSGHAFCVVPARRGDFPEKAATWQR